MKKKTEDRRTAYSKKMIRESLYELMKEKPLNKISVTEICQKADVNRSTFYAYYTDIYDLHQKIIKEFFEMHREILEKSKSFLETKPSLFSLSVDDYYKITYIYVKTAKDNQELYKFIFNQNSTNSIHVTYGKMFFRAMLDLFPETTPEKTVNYFKSAFTFVSGGTTSIIMDWLKKECPTSVESLSRSLAHYYYGIFNSFTNNSQHG